MINKSIGMPISRHITTVLVVNIKCPTDGSLLETVEFMLAYHSLFRERIWYYFGVVFLIPHSKNNAFLVLYIIQ